VVQREFREPIGTRGERILRVIIDQSGRIVTAFPAERLAALGLTAGGAALLESRTAEAAETLRTEAEDRARRDEERESELHWEEFIPFIGDIWGGSLNEGEDDLLRETRYVDAVIEDVIAEVEEAERRSLGAERRQQIRELIRAAMGSPYLEDEDAEQSSAADPEAAVDTALAELDAAAAAAPEDEPNVLLARTRSKVLGGGPEPEAVSEEGPVEVVEELVGEEYEEDGSAEEDYAEEDRETPVEISLARVAPGALRAGPDRAVRSKATTSVQSGASPTRALASNEYGVTWEESVQVTMGARKVGSFWRPVVKGLLGRYSVQARLLSGQSEVTGPTGNTTQANFCEQVTGLSTLGNTLGNPWYMLQAIVAHENVHATHLGPALAKAEPAITASIEAIEIPDVAGTTEESAVAVLKADIGLNAAIARARQTWAAEATTLQLPDHAPGGPCEKAEHAVVDPMARSICAHARSSKWGPCPACP
jgi:hypothetical protein